MSNLLPELGLDQDIIENGVENDMRTIFNVEGESKTGPTLTTTSTTSPSTESSNERNVEDGIEIQLSNLFPELRLDLDINEKSIENGVNIPINIDGKSNTKPTLSTTRTTIYKAKPTISTGTKTIFNPDYIKAIEKKKVDKWRPIIQKKTQVRKIEDDVGSSHFFRKPMGHLPPHMPPGIPFIRDLYSLCRNIKEKTYFHFNPFMNLFRNVHQPRFHHHYY